MKLQLMIALIVCLASILAVLAHCISSKERLHSAFLTMLYVCVGVYLYGYILELLGDTLEAAMTAIYMENLGVVLLAPIFLLFMLNATHSRLYRRWMVYGAGAYSLLVYIGILSNSVHGWYYQSATYLAAGDMHYVAFSYGPLYYFHQLVSIVCCAVGCIVPLLRMNRWNLRVRRCLEMMVFGAGVAIVSNTIYLTGLVPRQIDTTPIFITVVLLLCHWSISRNKMYNITGIASESAIQAMDDAVVILDAGWGYQFANESALQLFPRLKNLTATDGVEMVAGWPSELSAGCAGLGDINFEMVDQSGEKRHFHAHISAVGSPSTTVGWSIVIRDTTESIALLEQMQALAVTDSLTGAFNRRYFMECAQRQMDIEAREQRMSAMVFFDIDHFKVVNDTYGHQTGDVVLRMVAEMVRRELRSYDLFARYGGEEFAVYVINIQLEDAVKLAHRLCRSVRELVIRHQGEDIRVTASFGVAEVRWDSMLEDALNAADAAMYRAKHNGRDRVEVEDTKIGSMLLTEHVK